MEETRQRLQRVPARVLDSLETVQPDCSGRKMPEGDQLKVIDRLKEVELTEKQRDMLVNMVMDDTTIADVFKWWRRVG